MNLRLHVFFGQLLWLVAVLNGKSLQGVPGYGRNLIIKTLPAIEDYQSNVYEVFMEPYLYDLGRPVYPIAGNRAEKQIDLAVGPRSAPGIQAIVNLQADEESDVGGELVFTQIVPNGPVTIEGNVTGLSPGLHGVHVHQVGAIKDNCKDIGPHFIAYYPRLLNPPTEWQLTFTKIHDATVLTITRKEETRRNLVMSICSWLADYYINGRHGGPRDSIRHVGDLGNIKAEEGATVNVKIVDHLISLAGPRSVVGRSLAITKSEDDYGRASTEESALTGTSGPAVACGVIGYLN